jgi:N-acetylmuramoyl-L-alanine amidase
LERRLLMAAFLLLALVALWSWLGGSQGQTAQWREAWQQRPVPVAAAEGRRVGIIAGHLGNDSGAICENGVTEQETVAEIAERVADRLRRAGAEVDVLEEYDTRLQGYLASVLVSIHADSCIDRSGFKTARSQASGQPAVEDRLVACLNDAYAAATGLVFDPNSITTDMTGYHAFKRVDPQTPAAIIEVGFLGGDQRVLARADGPARGIAYGVLCFLESQSD